MYFFVTVLVSRLNLNVSSREQASCLFVRMEDCLNLFLRGKEEFGAWR